jgi:hypothetical protein
VGSLSGIIPARWIVPIRPTKAEQEILINWLAVEVPATGVVAAKAGVLSGWRNREVYWYVKGLDWTARMFE